MFILPCHNTLDPLHSMAFPEGPVLQEVIVFNEFADLVTRQDPEAPERDPHKIHGAF